MAQSDRRRPVVDWNRRADMLAGRISGMVNNLAASLSTAQDAASQQLDDEAALDWWETNRTSPYGVELVQRWNAVDPAQAAIRLQQIDARLAQRQATRIFP